MDNWQFLKPWIRVLRGFATVFPKQRSRNRVDREFSIAPRNWIRLRVMGNTGHSMVARALELMALGIRVDPHVWEMLDVLCYDPAGDGAWDNSRPEDLELRVEAVVANDSALEAYFQPLVVADDTDREGPLSVAAYLEAKRRLRALDDSGRLDDFQIPLTFSLWLQTENSVAQWIAMFENLAAGGSVAFGASTQQDTQRARYILESVDIETDRHHSPDFFRVSSGMAVQFGSRHLARLKELRVPITSIGGRAKVDSTFLHWMASDRPIKLSLSVVTNAELQEAYEACCRSRLGERLEALTLSVSFHGSDVVLVAMLLRDLSRMCKSLQYLELRVIDYENVWDALDNAIAEGGEQPGNSETQLPRASSIRALTMAPSLVCDTTRRVLFSLPKWLPGLQSLTLRRTWTGLDWIDDACLSLILQACPQLEALDVEGTNLTTWCELLDAYESRGCRIRTLVIVNSGVSYVPLLEALASPFRRIAQTVRELELGVVRQDETARSMLLAAEAMLQTNRSLACFLVQLESKVRPADEALRQRVLRFNQEPLRKLPRNLKVNGLAFLSAIQRSPALSSLGSDVFSLIFSMAFEPQLRLVGVRPVRWAERLC